MSIEVETRVKVYKTNYKEGMDVAKEREIKVRNNWDDPEMVTIDDGKNKYTVLADDLMRAIANAIR